MRVGASTEASVAPSSDAAFAFERETLGANELRILIANDLFRMHLEDGTATTTIS